ncbi:hypothetical protein N9D23_03355 [Rubripirellula sp.]|nr:hypothetical protein [Rubripirellula sp.]MDF1841847.1 hypothetical protein [Rubripirellula sp.]
MNESGYLTVEYSHTQRAPLCLVLYGFGVFCGLLLSSVDDPVGMALCTSFSLLFAVLGGAFHYLKVEDNGEELAIRFGPIPLFGRKLEYAEIQEVEVSRTILLDGWGIHYSLRGGWVWNLWGFDCVAIGLRNGGILRIGTNDPENLASFLKQKTNSSSLARD